LIVFSINDMSLLQEDMQEPLPNERMGSSDMGNVSQVVPSIHPCVVIVDSGTGGHTHEFAVAAASERGHEALMRSAKAMALTAVDLLTQPALMTQVNREFSEGVDLGAEWRKLRIHF
jgi:metal-dependent amidase/aminoacylase/carboxypeptidase family protein